MSKLHEKFLKDYSLNTLRDVNSSSLGEEYVIRYDAVQQKWVSRELSIKNTLKCFKKIWNQDITVESCCTVLMFSPEISGEVTINGELYIL